MKRIKEKINEIKSYLDELDSIKPKSLHEYKSSIEKKAACERYVEKIVEAATDLAFLIIKLKKFEIPEDDIDSFRILADKNIISSRLFNKLKNAKGLRNFLAHQYGRVDDKIVFESINEELDEDAQQFIKIASKIK